MYHAWPKHGTWMFRFLLTMTLSLIYALKNFENVKNNHSVGVEHATCAVQYASAAKLRIQSTYC